MQVAPPARPARPVAPAFSIAPSLSRLTTTSVRSRVQPESVVVSLFDPLLVHNNRKFRQRVTDLIAVGDVHIVLDLSQCGYVDAAGLGALVSCSRRLQNAGGSLTIIGASEDQRFLFRMTKLDTVLTLAPPGTEPI